MGRKSLAAERQAEILAAFERCIVRYGIDVSLDQIAEEAGVKRSLIRHYLGNRDEVVNQLIERIVVEYPERIAKLLEEALEQGVDGVLEFLFAEEVGITDWDAILYAVAGNSHERYPLVHQRISQMALDIVARTGLALQKLYPHATPDACYATAYGLISLSYTTDTLFSFTSESSTTSMLYSIARTMLQALEVQK